MFLLILPSPTACISSCVDICPCYKGCQESSLAVFLCLSTNISSCHMCQCLFSCGKQDGCLFLFLFSVSPPIFPAVACVNAYSHVANMMAVSFSSLSLCFNLNQNIYTSNFGSPRNYQHYSVKPHLRVWRFVFACSPILSRIPSPGMLNLVLCNCKNSFSSHQS